MAFKVLSLLSTVVVLFSMGVFMLTSPPLLVLKYDTPMDARFVRGLFWWYYTVLAAGALAGVVSYALLGNYLFSAGMAVLALGTLLVRRWMLRRMDAVRGEMTPGDKPRIKLFKKLHIGGMALNVLFVACAVAFLQQLAI